MIKLNSDGLEMDYRRSCIIRYGNLNRMLPVLEQLLANSRCRRKAEVMDVRKMIGKAAL